ncbi:glycosyltransferase [Rothia sp. 32237D007AR]
MGKKRIIIAVSDLFLPNGLVTSTRNLYDALMSQGYDVEYFLLYSADEDFRAHYNIFRINPWIKFTDDMKGYETSKRYLQPIRRLFGAVGKPIFSLRILWKLNKYRDDDVVIIGASLQSYNYISKLVKLDGIKRVVQLHMSRSGLTDQDVMNLKEALSSCDHATVLSETDKNLFTQEFSKEFHFVPNIVDINSPNGDLPHLDNNKIVYAGRFSETKQVDHLIQAFIKTSHEGWTLNLYGEGETKAELEKEYSSYPEIKFYPAVRDISQAFNNASLNVLSSQIEGLPMTIVEAAQLGIPTIAYNVSPGVEDIVSRCGILVQPQDIDSFSDALMQYMNDSKLRRSLGDKAQQYSERYRTKSVVETWENLFNGL